MKPTSKIYVAGNTGLVGSALMRNLEQQGFCNIITRSFTELDLRRQQDVEQFFEQELPEYVFLAAAKVGGIHANNSYKAEFMYDNLLIATNIIHAAHKTGVKKLLNLGSSCIYPKLAPQPIKEEYLLTGPLEPTNEPYAIAKIAAIKLCQYYNEQYGTNFISVMPTNLYGPNDNFDLQTAHVLPTLLRKFHLAKLLEQKDFDSIYHDFTMFRIGGRLLKPHSTQVLINLLADYGITTKSITLWGTGTPYREFLYVDDLAQACIFLMKNYNLTPYVNIGVGQDITIKDLAALLQKTVQYHGTINFDTTKPDGTPRKLLDVSKIHTLGWKHSITLETGICKAYQWYINQLCTQNQRSVSHAISI